MAETPLTEVKMLSPDCYIFSCYHLELNWAGSVIELWIAAKLLLVCFYALSQEYRVSWHCCAIVETTYAITAAH